MTGPTTGVCGRKGGGVLAAALCGLALVGAAGATTALAAGAARPASVALAEPKGDGVAALKESAAAIKALQSATFKASHSLSGVGMAWGGDVEVKWLRQPTGKVSLHMKGKVALPPKPATDMEVLIDASRLEGGHRTVVWVDSDKQAVYEQSAGPRSEAQVRVSASEELMLPPSLWREDPFGEDLRQATEASEEAAAEINGVLCRVVRLKFNNPGMQRVIALGVDDKLPRRYELIQGAGTKNPMSRVWDIKDVSLEKLTNEAFKVETPAGFKRERKEAAKPPAPPAPPAPGATKPATAPGATQPPAAMAPTGGLSAGAPAPSFELGIMAMGDAPESKFRSEDAKGTPVVLVFWSPLIPKSAEALSTTEKLVGRLGGDRFKLIGVGSRLEAAGATTEAQAGAVREFWKQHSLTMPAAMGNDGLISRLNVRGFPSIVVIDAQGRVAETMEGEVNQPRLEEVLNAASKAAK